MCQVSQSYVRAMSDGVIWLFQDNLLMSMIDQASKSGESVSTSKKTRALKCAILYPCCALAQCLIAGALGPNVLFIRCMTKLVLVLAKCLDMELAECHLPCFILLMIGASPLLHSQVGILQW